MSDNDQRNQSPVPPGYSTQPMQQQTAQQPAYQQAAPQQQAAYAQQTVSAPEPHRKKNLRTFWLAFAGAAAACVIAVVCVLVYSSATGTSVTGGSTVVIGSETSTAVSTDDDTQLAEAVSDKVLPSVVCIDVYTDTSSSYSSLFGNSNSSSSSSSLEESALGSGVIISTDGYILTNYHVIEDSAKLMVSVGDTDYEATVVGSDASSDLAVLKIDATGLTAIEIGDSSNLKTGEWVMSVGSPFGLEQSVATGIVSATSRTVSTESSSSSSSSSSSAIYTNMIQTDAAINPGNSGGALVDSYGKLIGINTLIASSSGNYSGVGFAIPVDYAIDIAQQIIDGKTPSHAQLGVSATTVNSQIAQRYSLSTDSGAYVSNVVSGSGAATAGIQNGDIITKVDGTSITSASDLTAYVRSKNIGDSVEVTVNRDGSDETMSVTLGSDGGSSASSSSSSSSGSSGNSYGYGYGYGGNSNSYGYGSNSGSGSSGLGYGSSSSGSSSSSGAAA